MSLAHFIRKWTHPEYPPTPISGEDLLATERLLSIRFPEAYRNTLLTLGIPRPSRSLLHSIVEQDLDLQAPNDFYSPDEIVEMTIGWRKAGMPAQLISIANDGCGNQFCFERKQLDHLPATESTIWFFDHDYGTTREVAPSFEAWIDSFLSINPSPDK